MPIIEYPAALPGPLEAPFQYAERRMLSTLPGPQNARAMSRDRLGGQPVEFCFSHAQIAIWEDWVENELIRAGAWFASNWKQPSGGVGVRRFVGEPSFPVYYPNHGWRVQAVVEVRGRGELPQNTGPAEPVTWSPTFKGTTIALSNGNLTATDPSNSMETYSTVRATVAPTSGKWYWEIVVDSLDEILDLFVGIITTDADWNTRFVANFPRYCYRSTGSRYDGSVTDGVYPELEVGDNVGIAWDVPNDKVWYRLNGSWLDGDPATGLDPSSTGEVTTETMTPSVGFDNNVGLAGVTAKFAAAAWDYAAPAGFSALTPD